MCMFIPYVQNAEHLIRETLQTISHNNNLVFPLLMYILISVLHWFPMRILTSMANNFFNAVKCSQAIKYIRRGNISNISESVLACTSMDWWDAGSNISQQDKHHYILTSTVFQVPLNQPKMWILLCGLSACLYTPHVSIDFPSLC